MQGGLAQRNPACSLRHGTDRKDEPILTLIPKRFTGRRVLLAVVSILLAASAGLAPPAWSQDAIYERSDDDRLYYEPEHFARFRIGDEGLQREDLLPLLSRQHAVIVVEKPNDYRKRLVRELLQQPPESLPPIAAFRDLPAPKADETFAIGYIQDALAARRMTDEEDFAVFLITFDHPLRLGVFLQALQLLADHSEVDYVMPAFFFSDKMAAPFPLFEAEFLVPQLIPGGISRITSLNRANQVQPVQDGAEDKPDFEQPVVLRLSKEAPSNILATVLRYQQMPGIVKQAQLRWLRLRMPVEVQASWELPAGINSFGIWEPVRYKLAIERDRDVDLLPKAFTEGAVRAWLSDNTKLPDELIQVDDIERQSRDLGDGRALDDVSLTFRLSKTGIYIFAPYPIQAAYAGLNDQRRIEVFNATAQNFLSIPGHLPRQVGQMPGQLLPVAGLRTAAWISPTSLALGVLCIVVGLIGALRVSNRTWSLRTSAAVDDTKVHEQALTAMRQRYRRRLGDLTRQAESLALQGHADATANEAERINQMQASASVRAWLRALSVFLKQLLGERCYEDEHRLLGGLGTSSATIRRYMLATSVNPQAAPVADALALLQAIEGQAVSQVLSLTGDAVDDLLSRATRLAEAFCE